MKFSNTLILLFLSFSLAFVSCGNHSEAWKSLDSAEAIMESRPDSALTILNSIQTETLSGKEEKARLALLMSMALDKNYVDTTEFTILQPAIDYYSKHGTPKEKLQTYYYQGRIYQNAGDNGNAMHAFLLGEGIAKTKDNIADTLTFARLLFAKAILLKDTYDFESYTTHTLEAAKYFKMIEKYDSSNACLMNALVGSILAENINSADSIANICKQLNQDGLLAFEDFYPDYITYLNKYGSKTELKHLLKHIERIDTLSDNSLLNIANVYTDLNEPEKALAILDHLDFPKHNEMKTKYTAIMVAIHDSIGDYKQAFEWLKKFESLLYEENYVIYQNKLLTSKQRYDENIEAQIKARHQDRLLWISISVIILLIAGIVVTFYMIKYYKMRKIAATKESDNLKIAKRILEINQERINAENKSKTLEAENLRHRIEGLEREVENLSDALNSKELPTEVKMAIKKRVELLNSIIASEISKDHSHEKLYENWIKQTLPDIEGFMNSNRLAFTASHPEFIKFLEQHELTVDEINYVCLYAIGLKGTDVGRYMKRAGHINMSSAIRKKLGLTIHDTQIKRFIMARFKDPSLLDTNDTKSVSD